MKVYFRHIIILSFLMLGSVIAIQADTYPTVSPQASFIGAEGDTIANGGSGSGPIESLFYANPSNIDEYDMHYTWTFYIGDETIVRNEENTSFTFTTSGTHTIALQAWYTKDNVTDSISVDQTFTITVTESKLEMPNAFSPNGDGINDIYQAKQNYKSIIEFHAYIFNRWGQKLYEWDSPAKGQGWDGTYRGKPVKDGVYYVLVKAKGADGTVFNIRKDVNILRGWSSSSTE